MSNEGLCPECGTVHCLHEKAIAPREGGGWLCRDCGKQWIHGTEPLVGSLAPD